MEKKSKFIGIAELSEWIGISRSRIYDGLLRQSDFPKPIKIGSHNRWDKKAIEVWLTDKAKEQGGDYVSESQ